RFWRPPNLVRAPRARGVPRSTHKVTEISLSLVVFWEEIRSFPLTVDLTDNIKFRCTEILTRSIRMAGQGKQAKVLTDAQVRRALSEVEHRRYPLRDRVMILLSVRAGLRAKEIAMAKWGMVMDADGEVGDAIHLTNKASKGRNGGRTIPLHKE